MKELPTVIASASKDTILAVVQREGIEPAGNRDAVDVLFIVRLEPNGPEKLLAVRLSGTVMSIRPEAFGVPLVRDRAATFQLYAEAAIGDALDGAGLPALEGRGGTYHAIDCFSPQLQGWRDRTPASDEEVESYLFAHALAAWRFSQPHWVVGLSDCLRLNRSMADIMRMARLHDGDSWTIADATEMGASLTPTPAFLRERRSKAKREMVDEVTVPTPPAVEPPTFVYVDESRIADLRHLEVTQFDLAKVIALCEELNICYRAQCYHAVAALTRALIDHVPPVFGCQSFAAVAATSSKSFKDSMLALESMARRIADQHLHGQIRDSEVLPTRVQVDFSQAVDVLLAEVVRVLRRTSKKTE